MPTKKLLVAFDPKAPDARSKDFLVPVLHENTPYLVGLRSTEFHEFGLVVFVGREITHSDLFAKLVDSGWKFDDVDRAVKVLSDYVEMLGQFKIGDVLELRMTGEDSFRLQHSGVDASGKPKC